MGRLLRAPQKNRTKANHAKDQVTIPPEVHIERARRVRDYDLRLTFSDGTERTVDFGPFLNHSTNPQIRAFLDMKRFASFRVENGDLVWGDWELCFPIADLYRGRV